ncbi:hypothetical protein [Kitasatospora sp. P5_F3]
MYSPDRTDADTHLCRAASLKLAEMAVGGSCPQCARRFGGPPEKAMSTMNKLRPQMAAGTLWHEFETRVENIARLLYEDEARTDYERRRSVLAYWQMPAGHRVELFDDLGPRFSRMAGEDGRLTATVLVWRQITRAEYTHSPVLTDMRRSGADTTRLIDNITQAYPRSTRQPPSASSCAVDSRPAPPASLSASTKGTSPD